MFLNCLSQFRLTVIIDVVKRYVVNVWRSNCISKAGGVIAIWLEPYLLKMVVALCWINLANYEILYAVSAGSMDT